MSDTRETCSACGENSASSEYLVCAECSDAHAKALIAGSRAEALEEAARYHDRKGDDARKWLDEQEQRAKPGVVASWRMALQTHRSAAVAIRALASTTPPASIPVETVREVLQAAYAGASTEHDLNATAVLSSVCEQLDVDPEPLRENGCHPWCVVEGEHEICLSDVLGESEPSK